VSAQQLVACMGIGNDPSFFIILLAAVFFPLIAGSFNIFKLKILMISSCLLES
jgi:hypothetical protein